MSKLLNAVYLIEVPRRYWTGAVNDTAGLQMSEDHNEAVRFARKEDAEAVIYRHLASGLGAAAMEHAWSDDQEVAEATATPEPDHSRLAMDIPGRSWSFPHCDATTLHAPGECQYCDDCPDAQNQRILCGVPFSGEPGAPDTRTRPHHTVIKWPGNRAVPPSQAGDLGADGPDAITWAVYAAGA